MAAVVLSSLFIFLAYLGEPSLMTRMTGEIASNLGPIASLLPISLHQGLSLLGEALCAWVLAWKMPPVISREQTTNSN
jgi:hypothetical protein